MKFHVSVAMIFIGSLVLFGLIYVAVDKASGAREREAHKELAPQKVISLREKLQDNPVKNIHAPIDQNTTSLIQAVAALSEEELGKEFLSLGERLKHENLFNKLEQGELDEHKKAEVKSLIERYTLLGLEGTRRKYLPLEPELKDAVYAHRDSLKDIRQLIDRY